ncbi:MAG TPA: diacylglycerol kinase family protein [Rubrobacter sp.]|nr:diacylglycerol kinase family protein [Rubrobacter sp.]
MRFWYFSAVVFGGGEAHLILNPSAGKGRAGGRRAFVSRFLEERGVCPIWHLTEGPGQAGTIVGRLPEDVPVVAVGGDGTVHEVAAACAMTGRIMGVLPAGSGNDYVKALGVGTGLRRALEILVGGKVRVVDTGEVNGVPFNNGLGIGFDAEVAAGVEEAPSYLGGTGRYLWSVGRLLKDFRCHEARLVLDGEVVESKTILVAVAIGTTYGSLFRLTPEAVLDDGLFDVIWSDEVNRAEVMRLIPSALRGTLSKRPKVHTARAREVEIELSKEVPAHVDGEMLVNTRHFRARVLPGALRVVAP